MTNIERSCDHSVEEKAELMSVSLLLVFVLNVRRSRMSRIATTYAQGLDRVKRIWYL